MAVVPQSWDQFENQYKLGLTNLYQKISNEVDRILDEAYHDKPMPNDKVKEEVTLAFDHALQHTLKNDFKDFLENVNNMLRQWQIPRGDVSPEARNRQTLGQDPNAPGPKPTNYAVPEWAKGLFDDVSNDPKVRQSYEDNAEGLSATADAKAENRLELTPALKLKMKMEPDELKAVLKKKLEEEYKPKVRMSYPGQN